MNPIYKFHVNRESHNLLDPFTMRDGFALSSSTGAVSASSGSQVSAYMQVEPGVTYKLKNSQGEGMAVNAIAFYDYSFAFVSGASSVITAEAPAGAAFARISLPISINAADWQFADSSLNYVAYVSPRVFPTYNANESLSFEKEGGQEFFRRKQRNTFRYSP